MTSRFRSTTEVLLICYRFRRGPRIRGGELVGGTAEIGRVLMECLRTSFLLAKME